ncbi:hypothetical protein GCM10009863_51250 [Streptomyces axinellae]|uniref:Head-to-tail connector protein n=1 Tax=Streptomyces axinellae TaxID=552788 RepID=A0ABP6D1C7_9ACTN
MAVVGGALKKYKVVTASGVETVMKLNEADASRYGVAPGEPEQPAEQEKSEPKKRAAANKSRTAANKDGGTDGADD